MKKVLEKIGCLDSAFEKVKNGAKQETERFPALGLVVPSYQKSLLSLVHVAWLSSCSTFITCDVSILWAILEMESAWKFALLHLICSIFILCRFSGLVSNQYLLQVIKVD